ncbi:MarR family transcriptional regulator [Methanofollis sp. W23]|uniref:helix-turn-helix transcriptional regulator n=1 Tax=Methanofollis sp. W23 TaxID=2817849 RepID=UPI001AEB747C|nr:MarR family transcriptional regulator [Methanofollis sp. W23]
MDQRGRNAFAGGIIAIAILTLLSIFILPRQVQIVIGDESPVVHQIPSVYTLSDCLLIALVSSLLGAVLFYLLVARHSISEEMHGPVDHENDDIEIEGTVVSPSTNLPVDCEDAPPPHSPHVIETEAPPLPQYQQAMLRLLKGNERKIIETLIDHGEMNQTKLSERTGIPKSTLSRTLQDLEARDLVRRYENGMSKMVKLEV